MRRLPLVRVRLLLMPRWFCRKFLQLSQRRSRETNRHGFQRIVARDQMATDDDGVRATNTRALDLLEH